MQFQHKQHFLPVVHNTKVLKVYHDFFFFFWFFVVVVLRFFLLFYIQFFLIGVQLIYNVVLISGVQQSESVIHIHISTLFFFQIVFPYRPLHSIEFPVLYSRFLLVNLFYIQQCVYVSPSLPIYAPPCNRKFVFYICSSTSVF